MGELGVLRLALHSSTRFSSPRVVPLLSLFSSCGKLEAAIFRFCTSLDINADCGGDDLYQAGCGGGTYDMVMDSSFQSVYRVSMMPRICVLVPAVAWILESTTQR